jgi:hypothetical protein
MSMRDVQLRTFAFVSLTLAGLAGCGNPCLDDGFGKGECVNQTGADEASTTEASATGTAEGTADGNSESASGTAEEATTDPTTEATTEATTDPTTEETTDPTTDATTDATEGETGVDACNDMMLSEGETDLDCGGVCVLDPLDPLNPEGKCGPGQDCLIDGDCISNFCDPQSLTCVDLCTNMVEDASETDVDCGAACVVDPNDPANPEGKCDDGEGCLVNSDCVSNSCDPDELVCVGECSNGMVDPNETDVDCGDDCVIVNPDNMNDVEGQCNQGEMCNDPTDCVAGDCIDNACDVCAVQDQYTTCQTCLVTECCLQVQECLADIPKCVCWFNCIGTMGSTVQGCMDTCGNGNIGTINACLNNSCKGPGECN